MEFVRAKKEDLPAIYAQMQDSFIIDEIRDYSDIVRLYGDNYSIEHIINDGKKVGFMGLWKIEKYTFLEHFVIYKDYRNRNLGGQALELLQKKTKFLLLESDPPIEPIAIRRINFYLRHGMKLNQQDYYQPPYRKTGNACYMKLMSYPDPLPDFDNVAEKIYNIVYGTDYEERKHY